MNKFGLDDETLSLIIDFFKDYVQIKSAKIFGSRAIGTYRHGSDIDISLFGDLDDNLMYEIKDKIEELPTPYMFDVLNYQTIENKNLKKHIDDYGVTLYHG